MMASVGQAERVTQQRVIAERMQISLGDIAIDGRSRADARSDTDGARDAATPRHRQARLASVTATVSML